MDKNSSISVRRKFLTQILNALLRSFNFIVLILVITSVAALFFWGREDKELLLIFIGWVLGLSAGILLSAKLFNFLLKRTTTQLSKIDMPDEIVLRDEKQSQLKELYQLLYAYENKIAHFTDSVSEIGIKAERIIERYEILTENLAAAVVIRDADGTISYCSPYTEVLTGYSLSNIYGKKDDFFVSITHEEDRDKYARSLKVSTMGEAFQFRYRFYHRSGIEMWADTRTVPILDDMGSVVSTLSITLDVTGTARYQQQVEEKNRDLQDFTYMVTHDLKAPIFTIKGMLGVISEDFGDKLNSDLAEPIDHIASASKRLEQLVASVLEYSKLTAMGEEKEKIHLKDVVDDVFSDFKAQLENINATIILPDNLPTVLAERVRLYQVFSNLIGNAVKYRDTSRDLMIEIELIPSASERYITIALKDNGSGIPEDRQEAVFRPFQRAHRGNIEGSGIGLACVKRIVEKFGGSIRLESKEGAGSTFYITLLEH